MQNPKTKLPHSGPEARLWKNLNRNVRGMLVFELTWGFGLPFGLYASMVPAYLTAMGSSKSLMGFAQSLWTILIPLQLLGGHFLTGKRRLHSVVTLYMIATGIRLLYDVFAVFVPGMWTPPSLVAFFVLANSGYVGLLLLGQSLYMGVLTDNIPKERRGWLFGLRTFCNGAGGILMGFAASWVLHRWASPLNFRVSFLICDTFWTLSSLSLLQLRDQPVRRAPSRTVSFFRSLGHKVKILLANPNYRIFLFFHILNTVGLNVATFIIPYAQERLGVSDDQVAWLSVIYLGANAAFGTLVGKLADKTGYRSVGALQSLLLIAFYIIAITARSFPAICAAYALYSVVNISGSFTLVNMSVELCPSIDVTDLTALGGVFLLPFVATATPLAGGLIDATGSYPLVFSIGITLAVVAVLGFGLLVREPRTGRVYAIKQIDAR